MTEHVRSLMLSLIAILVSLRGSTAYECSSAASNRASYSSCPSDYYYGSFNSSANASVFPDVGNPQQGFYPDPFDVGPALLYILIDLAPVMVYFPLLILFNVNLAAGPAQSFVFFYQAIPAAVPIDSVQPINFGLLWGLPAVQSPINDVVFPRILPYIALQYCKLAFALLVMFLTLALVRCIDCPCASWRRPWAKIRRSVRHFRDKRAQRGTVLNALCSIAILTYGFVIQQAFSLLQPATERSCQNNAKHCLYYCTQLNYTSLDYYPYLFVALISLLLVLPLPLLLLYYPCVPALMQRITKRSSPLITCHKLAPVFDVFQSAYKPKLRFFASLPLLYRIVIWVLFSALSAKLSRSDRQLAITFVFIFILAIHSLVQPYSKPRHNYIETLYLVNLMIISLISITTFGSVTPDNFNRFISLAYMATVFAVLPLVILLIGAVHFLWKCKCSKRCRTACCPNPCFIGFRKSKKESAPDENYNVISEVYLDMKEVEISQDEN